MATNRAGDEVDLTTWIGRTESTRDVVAPTPVAAMHATLDYPVGAIPSGTVLPPLWHWLYFLPLHRQSELGPDGHAPDADVATFGFRAVRPTFDLHPFQVNGDPGDDGTVRLWSQDHEGLLTMDAVATLRPQRAGHDR